MEVGRHTVRIKVWEGMKSRGGVSRYVNFRDDDDTPRGSFFADVRHILKGEIATFSPTHAASRGFFYKLGKRGNLNAPALVIGKVQVKPVESQIGHKVKNTNKIVRSKKVSNDINAEATPRKFGTVNDRHIRNRSHAAKLGEDAPCVTHTVRAECPNRWPTLAHFEAVRLAFLPSHCTNGQAQVHGIGGEADVVVDHQWVFFFTRDAHVEGARYQTEDIGVHVDPSGVEDATIL